MDDAMETPVVGASKAYYVDGSLMGGTYTTDSSPGVQQDSIKRSISRSRNSKPPSRYLDNDEVSPTKRIRLHPKSDYGSPSVPLAMKLAYVLPYAAYHESRQNWRPLLFAKYFGLVANASSVEEALGRLLAPNVFLQWSQHYWPSSPRQAPEAGDYRIKWSSSTAPPVVSPLDFVAWGCLKGPTRHVAH